MKPCIAVSAVKLRLFEDPLFWQDVVVTEYVTAESSDRSFFSLNNAKSQGICHFSLLVQAVLSFT